MNLFYRFDEALNFLHQSVGCRAKAIHDAFRPFLKRNRLKGFGLFDLCGGLEVGLAEIAFGYGRLGRFLRQSFRGQTGGDVLRALDFVGMAVVIDLVLNWRAAHGFGARLTGVTVLALLAMAQTARRTKTHTAAAPGKISVTHRLISLSIDIDVLQHAYGD